MKTLYIDIECYSDTDLSSCGVYKYAEDPDFEILLFGYAVDDSDIHVVDLTNGEKIPEEVINALVDENITKVAHNAMFERVCLSAYLHKYYSQMLGNVSYIPPTNWRCSMIHGAYLGLPFSLEQVGLVLGLEEQKLKEGKDLIKYFCMPCKPTKANGMRVRNMPSHDKAKWELFKKYNKRDVEVEISICKRLKNYSVPDFVWREYETDQEINDRGVLLDIVLVKNAIDIADRSRTNLMDRLKRLTNLENPNSVIQMREWLKENGIETDSLDKKSVESLLESDISNEAKEVLNIRQSLAKSSIKKYERMRDVVCTDNRARGLFQFYGANHSGRYSSRLIQIQNLARNSINDLELARDLVKVSDYETLSLVYGNTADILSQLLRTALIPKKNHKFVVADYSAIEARVLSWLAGEPWRIKAFENGEDIYCSTATQMFKVKVVKHGENGELRQKGKVAELACGYGGSVGALKAFGAEDMGLDEVEMQLIVNSWRGANPNIVSLWYEVDRAVKNAIRNKETTIVRDRLKIGYKSGMLYITLPSDRSLHYAKPEIIINRFGTESVSYYGLGQGRKWTKLESYGAKFVENIVQGIARDILTNAMEVLKEYRIVATVHDEIIVETNKDMKVDFVCRAMCKAPKWADGLPLDADGYECEFYKKD